MFPNKCGHWNVLMWKVMQCKVSASEQLPEDGQVRPKHVAVDCNFNVILN
jgi:hypothetical protein